MVHDVVYSAAFLHIICMVKNVAQTDVVVIVCVFVVFVCLFVCLFLFVCVYQPDVRTSISEFISFAHTSVNEVRILYYLYDGHTSTKYILLTVQQLYVCPSIIYVFICLFIHLFFFKLHCLMFNVSAPIAQKHVPCFAKNEGNKADPDCGLR